MSTGLDPQVCRFFVGRTFESFEYRERGDRLQTELRHQLPGELDRLFLEVSPNEKLPSISKNV